MLEVWPEHWEAWDVFSALENSWRMVDGLSGTRYQGISRSEMVGAMDLLGVKKKRRVKLLTQLRRMEAEALVAIYEANNA